jgi:hypothetical protein
MIAIINNYIQGRLQQENLSEVTLVQAAMWLDKGGILKDQWSSPGYPLRRHIHRENIFGAYKKYNKFWYIKKIDNYDQIIGVEELIQTFKLKSKKSIYKKIKIEQIPYSRINKRGIYFKKNELLRWAFENKKNKFFELL